MNTGTISARYAKAMFLYTEETGGSERVCAQVRSMLANPDGPPERLEPELENFLQMVLRRGRMEYVKFMLRSYVALYYRSRGIKLATLVTPAPATDELVDKLCGLLETRFGCKVLFEKEVNPSVIGGFLIVIDDYMLDATVRHQIDSIRRQFAVQNTRLV